MLGGPLYCTLTVYTSIQYSKKSVAKLNYGNNWGVQVWASLSHKKKDSKSCFLLMFLVYTCTYTLKIGQGQVFYCQLATRASVLWQPEVGAQPFFALLHFCADSYSSIVLWINKRSLTRGSSFIYRKWSSYTMMCTTLSPLSRRCPVISPASLASSSGRQESTHPTRVWILPY